MENQELNKTVYMVLSLISFILINDYQSMKFGVLLGDVVDEAS